MCSHRRFGRRDLGWRLSISLTKSTVNAACYKIGHVFTKPQKLPRRFKNTGSSVVATGTTSKSSATRKINLVQPCCCPLNRFMIRVGTHSPLESHEFYGSLDLPDSHLDPSVKYMHMRPETRAPISFILSFNPLALSWVSWQKYGGTNVERSAPSMAMQRRIIGSVQASVLAAIYALRDICTS